MIAFMVAIVRHKIDMGGRMKQARKRDNHVNQKLTAFDFGYRKSWRVKMPTAKIGRVSFDIK